MSAAGNARGVGLRVPTTQDIEQMWQEENSGQRANHWRLGGTTVGLDEFRSIVWTTALHQWVVVEMSSEKLLGVVMSYDYSPWDGHCKVGICSYSGSGSGVLIGLAMSLDKIFNSVPVRKVYFEIPDVFEDRFERALERLCLHEGTIKGYRFAEGRWVSLNVWSLSRVSWNDPSQLRIRRLLGR